MNRNKLQEQLEMTTVTAGFIATRAHEMTEFARVYQLRDYENTAPTFFSSELRTEYRTPYKIFGNG